MRPRDYLPGTLLLLLLMALAVVARMWEPGQQATKVPTSAEEPITGASDRPNIVLISLDTVRPDHLGCYGYHDRQRRISID